MGVGSRSRCAAGAGLVLTLGACGNDDSGVRVVATTTQVADWADQIKGEGFTVHQLLKPNTDPHEYEPRPDDVEALADADVIFRSGGDLDDWVDEAAADAGSDAEVIDLSNGLPHLRRPGGELDPHWWHDPRNMTRAVLRMAEALVRAAPEREAQVAQRTRSYAPPGAARRTSRWGAACAASRPPSASSSPITMHSGTSLTGMDWRWSAP